MQGAWAFRPFLPCGSPVWARALETKRETSPFKWTHHAIEEPDRDRELSDASCEARTCATGLPSRPMLFVGSITIKPLDGPPLHIAEELTIKITTDSPTRAPRYGTVPALPGYAASLTPATRILVNNNPKAHCAPQTFTWYYLQS